MGILQYSISTNMNIIFYKVAILEHFILKFSFYILSFIIIPLFAELACCKEFVESIKNLYGVIHTSIFYIDGRYSIIKTYCSRKGQNFVYKQHCNSNTKGHTTLRHIILLILHPKTSRDLRRHGQLPEL